MGFMDLLFVASMPILQVLIISCVGAFLATERCSLLMSDARKSLNKIVFYIFTPSLIFGSLAKTITLEEIVSWWFMPVNIGIIFFVGSLLGWILVKILRLDPYLKGLVIASCSAGNLGNLMFIVIPAICDENNNLFGKATVCRNNAFSYASFSMAVGVIYIFTVSYNVMRESAVLLTKSPSTAQGIGKVPNRDRDTSERSQLLKNDDDETRDIERDQTIICCQSGDDLCDTKLSIWGKIKRIGLELVGEFLSPPTCSALAALVVGATPWLKSLIIGSTAPFRVLEDSLKLLGDGTIPSVTLILGGNLTKGMSNAKMRKSVVIGVIFVRYVVLPLLGIAVVTGAAKMGLLPLDPLFQYVLLMQYTLPPAMNIGTMTELFNVGQEECSVIFLWTYIVAAFALTGWSMVYMWILTNAG